MVNARKIASRDILLYTGTRYFEFTLKFFYGLLIAKVLGPELFGVWGFLMLVQQYLLYSGLGFQHVVTVELSNKSNSTAEEQEHLIANALGATVAVSIIISLIGLTFQIGGFGLFSKFQLSNYAFLMAAMVGMMHIVNVLLCAYRVYGDVQKISIAQLLRVAVPMLTLFVFPAEQLITAMVAAMLLANAMGIALFVHNSPFRIRLALDAPTAGKLLRLGLPLLVYNVAFNLIMISARTVLSIYYSVAIMGLYSFASSITNAMLLGFKSVVFVLMPDIIYQTRQEVDNREAFGMVRKVNRLYSTGVFAAAWGIVIGQPILFLLLPEFKGAGLSICILMLAQAVLSATFGFNTLALSRGHQMAVAAISMQAVLFVSVASLIVANSGLGFEWIAVAVLAGAYLFTLLQTRLGTQLLSQSDGEQPTHLRAIGLASFNPFHALSAGNTAAILLFVIGSFYGYGPISGFLSATLFILVNMDTLKELVALGLQRKKVV